MADPNPPSQNPQSTVSVRGPLRYEIETSSPMVEAGRPFSVFLRVTNPYEVPVTILEVGVMLPVEFQNETLHFRDDRLVWRNQLFRGAITKGGTTSSGLPGGVAVAVTSRTGGLGGSRGSPDQPHATLSLKTAPEESPRRIGQALECFTIQPGDTLVHQVSLRTRRWLFFSPAVYNLEAQIDYKLDDQDHHDSVKVPLSVKAQMTSLIVGAVVGSLAGGVVRAVSDNNIGDLSQMLAKIAISAIVSAMVIVAFARKKDAQPFISVEDFFGGMFVGFSVGLASQSWLEWLSKPPPTS